MVNHTLLPADCDVPDMSAFSALLAHRQTVIASAGSAALLLAVSVSAGPASAAVQVPTRDLVATCPTPGGSAAPGDIDGDGVSDTVVGMPASGVVKTSGALDLTFSTADAQHVNEDDIDVSATAVAKDAFGKSIAVGLLLSGDTCTDVAAGAPGRDGTGAVVVVPGGSTGIEYPGGVVTINGLHHGDLFGASVAVEGTDLWVGAPGVSVAGQVGAGAVYHYSLSTGEAVLVNTIVQGTLGVDGTPEAGDGFGTSLAANEFGVIIGTPNEDVGTLKDAGTATFYKNPSVTSTFATTTWSQNSSGVAGSAEAGDLFGASVAADSQGDSLIVGVPGEDIGSAKDAGIVQTFAGGSGHYVPHTDVSQNTSGIPGTAEAGDRFGASVALGQAIICAGAIDAAVGAPGEDVGSIKDAGSVTLFAADGPHCTARSLTQGSGGLAGGVETGDAVGSAVAVRRAASHHDVLLVGTPGEDIGTVKDAGLVTEATFKSSSGGSTTLSSMNDSRGATAGAAYGGVLAASQN
jgi:hypothetical protein